MNQVQLVGNLTRDPDGGTTQNGIAYCRFSVACQRRFKNANGTYDADFINCLAWRQTAEFVQRHFIKGNKIGLTGSIQTGSYTAQDGSKRYTTGALITGMVAVTASPHRLRRTITGQSQVSCSRLRISSSAWI